MANPVWHRIDAELTRRRKKHLAPSSWAALGRMIDASNQTLTNWKTRGVPPKEHLAVAGALGWSVDRLLGKEVPEVAPVAAVAPPPPPPPGYQDRHEIDDSDWATLQAVKMMLPEAQLAEMRERHARAQALLRKELAIESEKAKRGKP